MRVEEDEKCPLGRVACRQAGMGNHSWAYRNMVYEHL